MREIKFRAWDSDEKTMCPVYELHFGERIIVARVNARNGKMLLVFSDETNLMQYTGVKDKNGVEIYEGDILLDDFAEEYYIVKFFDGAFIAECDGVIYDLADVALITAVVGNIYENPELVSNETDT